tara:strand:- start:93 stop:299 length:207 start_codon:yes stop_codon:yes gene_type:complete
MPKKQGFPPLILGLLVGYSVGLCVANLNIVDSYVNKREKFSLPGMDAVTNLMTGKFNAMMSVTPVPEE